MLSSDFIKEEIGYLKFWLGIAAAVAISLIGWLVAHFQSSAILRLLVCYYAIVGLVLFIARYHSRIEHLLRELKEGHHGH